MKAIYLTTDPENLRRVWGESQQARLAAILGEAPALSDGKTPSPETELAFSTWGMPILTGNDLKKRFPNLRAVFYAAGSVQSFAQPLLENGIRLFSAWQANAIPVVQYTTGQILLALKGYFTVQPLCRTDRGRAKRLAEAYPGCFEVTIGLLGCGAIGSRVAEQLTRMGLRVLVFDPFLPEERAGKLGVTRTDPETIFRECDVISNHLADLPGTRGILRREHFRSMKPHAVFINTGRGPQLNEDDLYEALTEEPGRTALLDVMIDEEQSTKSPLNRLENCLITPHIAGSSGNEVHRMAEYMIDALEDLMSGKTSPHEVTAEMLKTMA